MFLKKLLEDLSKTTGTFFSEAGINEKKGCSFSGWRAALIVVFCYKILFYRNLYEKSLSEIALFSVLRISVRKFFSLNVCIVNLTKYDIRRLSVPVTPTDERLHHFNVSGYGDLEIIIVALRDMKWKVSPLRHKRIERLCLL